MDQLLKQSRPEDADQSKTGKHPQYDSERLQQIPPVKASPLLELPAELRNRIYEYALVHHRQITIHPHTSEPGLLRSCKQIRKEALEIYYVQNRFIVAVVDCNVSHLLIWQRRMDVLDIDEVLNITFAGRLVWSSLMEWFKDLHSGAGRRGGARVENYGPFARFMTAATELYSLLYAETWETYQSALDTLKYGIGDAIE